MFNGSVYMVLQSADYILRSFELCKCLIMTYYIYCSKQYVNVFFVQWKLCNAIIRVIIGIELPVGDNNRCIVAKFVTPHQRNVRADCSEAYLLFSSLILIKRIRTGIHQILYCPLSKAVTQTSINGCKSQHCVFCYWHTVLS